MRLTDARRWEQQTEADIRTGKHFHQAEAKKHTLAELIQRYRQDVLPQKSPTMMRDQQHQLGWWEAQLGKHTLAAITPAMLVRCRDKLSSPSNAT